jgi:hypothetical protein
MKQANLRDISKMASKSVCTPVIVVSPNSMSPTPSTFTATMTPENTEEDPDDPEPADEGDPSRVLLRLVSQPKYRSRNKKLPVRNQVSTGAI